MFFAEMLIASMLLSTGITLEPPTMIIPPDMIAPTLPESMTRGRSVTYIGNTATVCSEPIGSNPGQRFLFCNVYTYIDGRWIHVGSFVIWLPPETNFGEQFGGSGTYTARLYT